MKTIMLYAPEAAEMAAGAEPLVNDSTISTPLIPRKQYGIGLLAERAAQKWAKVPGIALLYTTPAELAANTTLFLGMLEKRQKDGSDRSPITAGLEKADSDMERGIRKNKAYLVGLYEENAADHYPSFGLEHVRKAWRLPYSRSKRRELFKLIMASVEKHGFADKEYGKAFWAELATRYEQLLTSSTGTDGKVSVQVSSKNELKEWLVMVLQSLALSIEANYPQTFKGELRDWGFQKNKY
jgi:hypothetical protein